LRTAAARWSGWKISRRPTTRSPNITCSRRSANPTRQSFAWRFPAGFYKQTDSGDTNRGAIPFRIEFKQHSSSTWIKGPEIHISPLDDFAKPLRQHIILDWDTSTGTAPSSSHACYYAYGYTGASGYNWQANSYFRQTGTLKPAKNVRSTATASAAPFDGHIPARQVRHQDQARHRLSARQLLRDVLRVRGLRDQGQLL
jgi:hypothetical protein